MSVEELARVQDLLVGMLEALDRASRATGVPYYLAYGTALGAVRDHDIIAWDWDADVHLPVDGYHALVGHLQADEASPYSVIQVGERGYDKLFARVRARGVDEHLAHVDLFPLSGASPHRPVRVLERIMAAWVCRAYKAKVVAFADRYSPTNWKFWAGVAGHTLLAPFPRRVWVRVFAWLARRPPGDARYVANPAGSYGRREVFDGRTFGEGTSVLLRGRCFCAPRLYGPYLRQLYGDYNQPAPPAEQRAWLDRFETEVRRARREDRPERVLVGRVASRRSRT